MSTIGFAVHFLPLAHSYYGNLAPEDVVNAKARCLARRHTTADNASSVEEQAADIAILVAYAATLAPVIIPEVEPAHAPVVVYVSARASASGEAPRGGVVQDPVALVNEVARAPYFAHRLALKSASGEDCRALLDAIVTALKTGKVGA